MVSNLGRVKTVDRQTPPDPVHPNGVFVKGKILSAIQNKHKYESVLVSHNPDKRVYVHRLVAEAFIHNSGDKREVNHKNGNTKDNRAENLEWVSSHENKLHARDVLHRYYNNKGCKKVFCVELNKSFNSMCEACRFLGDYKNKGGGIGLAIKFGGTAKGFHWKYI